MNVYNNFIDYLNSMTNANSNNKNAIAESQVNNEYYKKIKVERNIGERLYELFFESEEKHIVILTGHAGDGKTSILNQILYRIEYFNSNNGLKEEDTFNNEFYYIKDMSELNTPRQDSLMMKAIKNKSYGISSLIITNTGPLINTVKRLTKNSLSDESEIIEGIKKEGINDIELNIDDEKYNIKILNIANFDNIYFVEDFINNITEKELWTDCFDCEKRDKCPIYFNYNMIINYKETLIEMIQNIYLYLREKDVRLTIRQIVSHLSYSITGTLNCEDVLESDSEIFDNAFPNLFFGYKGLEEAEINIMAINSLMKLGFEKKPIESIDHDLLINKNINKFDSKINKLLNNLINNKMEKLEENNLDSFNIRTSLRRFQILLKTSRDTHEFIEVFGKDYKYYIDSLVKDKLTFNDEEELNEILYRALYKLFVGIFPKKDERNLYITLKKEYNVFTNVQMILGEVPKKNINIVREKLTSSDKLFVKYKLNIMIKNLKRITMTFSDFEFLYKIGQGMIMTDFETIQDQKMTYIKTLILNNGNYKTDKFRLITFGKDGIKDKKVIIRDNKINIR